jgi:hypothetical protein
MSHHPPFTEIFYHDLEKKLIVSRLLSFSNNNSAERSAEYKEIN